MPKSPISSLQLDNLICDPNPMTSYKLSLLVQFYGAHNKLKVVPAGTPMKKNVYDTLFGVTPFGDDNPTTNDDPMFWR